MLHALLALLAHATVSATWRTSSAERQLSSSVVTPVSSQRGRPLPDVAGIADDVHLLDELVGDQRGRLLALALEEQLLHRAR